MKIACLITGSRHWTDEAAIRRVIEALPEGSTLIVGDCPTGADAIAFRIAKEAGFAVWRCEADWNKHGKRAGPLRNGQMVRVLEQHWLWGYSQQAHAFPLPGSKGTYDCIKHSSDCDCVACRPWTS